LYFFDRPTIGVVFFLVSAQQYLFGNQYPIARLHATVPKEKGASMRKRLATTFVLLTLLSTPNVVMAQDGPDDEAIARAQDYFSKGKVSFQLGKFEEAIVWFEKAYEETEYPDFLLNIAQSYKQLHRCDKAIFFYKQYKQQDNVDKDGVQKLIVACEEELRLEPPKSQPSGNNNPPKILPSPNLSKPSSISLFARGAFAAGSVGSKETGGRNITGAGFSVGSAFLFNMTPQVSFGAMAALEGRTTGLVVAADPGNEILQSPDLRFSGAGVFVYGFKPKMEAMLDLGLTIGADGARPVAARVAAEFLYELKSSIKLNASLGYETARADKDFDLLLGCSDDTRCSYQQLDLSIGAWYQLF
jgi:tetratricopeptide (TPR) repeat protein